MIKPQVSHLNQTSVTCWKASWPLISSPQRQFSRCKSSKTANNNPLDASGLGIIRRFRELVTFEILVER